MIRIQDKTNTTAPSASEPFGNVKDDDGTFNGTPLNKEFFNDYIQFFEKLFAESNLNHNGLLDNETNGFQLFDALKHFVKDFIFEKYDAYGDVPGQALPLTDNVGDIPLSPKKTLGIFHLTNEFNSNTQVSGISGINASPLMPLGTVFYFFVSNLASIQFILNTDEADVLPNEVVRMSGNTTTNDLFTLPLITPVQFMAMPNGIWITVL